MRLFFSALSTQAADSGIKRISTQAQFDALVVESGDTIELLGGETFVGSLLIDQDDVTVKSYGTGRAHLYGGDPVTGFTDNLDGTFSKTVANVKWMFKNGARATMAQTDFIPTTGGTTSTLNVSHGNVSGYTNIVGSYLMHKARKWRYDDRQTVTNYNGAGTISVTPVGSAYWSGGSLRLLNDVEYFNLADEFVYRNGDVTIKSVSEPVGFDAITRDNGIHVTGANCTVNNVEISGFYNAGVLCEAENSTVTNCYIHDIVGNGIFFAGLANAANYSYNTLEDIGFSAIVCRFVVVNTIMYNTINRVGVDENRGFRTDSRDILAGNSGIIFNGEREDVPSYPDGGEIAYNNIQNVGYCGIKMEGTNNHIHRNVINNAMLNTADGGAMYGFGGNENSPGDPQDFESNIIEYNFTSNVYSSFEGQTDNGVASGSGIYLDNESSFNIVRYNTCYDGNAGIRFSAGGHGNQCIDNVCQNIQRSTYWNTNRPGTAVLVNDQNVCNGNRFAGVDANTRLFRVIDDQPGYNPYANGGSTNGNYWVSPLTTFVGDSDQHGDMTLAQLQTNYGQNANDIAIMNTNPQDILLIANPTDAVLNGSVGAGYEDLDGNPVTNYAVAAWRSIILIKP